ncbi:uncharacterized protein METZ01_LOCUS66758 [marine metagenome]|uniref:Major capsid protein N-terminal domain-containing protein n=1 Tax=marine metagenome TaxID=408172 RepID=A0A381TDS7_9ZZZZ
MGGGLMQLVAYGAQDIYLTGNPQITFFKVVYRRHTNFSMEAIEQTFNGSADFGKKVSVTVSRNGDLITKCYLNAELPAQPDANSNAENAYISEVGHYLMKSCEVEIGGQRIDKHYGAWLAIWSSLSCPAGKEDEYQSKMVEGGASGIAARSCIIPLQFWFCRHTGLALPLIALQYHEVKFAIEFESLSNLVKSTAIAETGSMTSASMYVDYIYLDTEERRRFAQISHEYLIEQLQFTGDESVSGASSRVKLNFNHPVKELVWVCQSSALDASNFSDAAAGVNPCESAKLQLNGHDRFSQRDGSYFNVVQPYQHHSNIPSTGINCYSFALKPEEQQPSGSANMSRIDNATLQLNCSANFVGLTNPVVKVFASNYNVLRIMSGMGGLAYSN